MFKKYIKPKSTTCTVRLEIHMPTSGNCMCVRACVSEQRTQTEDWEWEQLHQSVRTSNCGGHWVVQPKQNKTKIRENENKSTLLQWAHDTWKWADKTESLEQHGGRKNNKSVNKQNSQKALPSLASLYRLLWYWLFQHIWNHSLFKSIPLTADLSHYQSMWPKHALLYPMYPFRSAYFSYTYTVATIQQQHTMPALPSKSKKISN